MTAQALIGPREMRSDQSRRLSSLKSEAAKIREELASEKITTDEAIRRLEQLKRRHSTFFSRMLEY